jgi:hypothetical protein
LRLELGDLETSGRAGMIVAAAAPYGRSAAVRYLVSGSSGDHYCDGGCARARGASALALPQPRPNGSSAGSNGVAFGSKAVERRSRTRAGGGVRLRECARGRCAARARRIRKRTVDRSTCRCCGSGRELDRTRDQGRTCTAPTRHVDDVAVRRGELSANNARHLDCRCGRRADRCARLCISTPSARARKRRIS